MKLKSTANTGDENNQHDVSTNTHAMNDEMNELGIEQSRPVSELTTGNLIDIINRLIAGSINALKTKIVNATNEKYDALERKVDEKVIRLENRVKTLETDIERMVTQNQSLNYVVWQLLQYYADYTTR